MIFAAQHGDIIKLRFPFRKAVNSFMDLPDQFFRFCVRSLVQRVDQPFLAKHLPVCPHRFRYTVCIHEKAVPGLRFKRPILESRFVLDAEEAVMIVLDQFKAPPFLPEAGMLMPGIAGRGLPQFL